MENYSRLTQRKVTKQTTVASHRHHLDTAAAALTYLQQMTGGNPVDTPKKIRLSQLLPQLRHRSPHHCFPRSPNSNNAVIHWPHLLMPSSKDDTPEEGCDAKALPSSDHTDLDLSVSTRWCQQEGNDARKHPHRRLRSRSETRLSPWSITPSPAHNAMTSPPKHPRANPVGSSLPIPPPLQHIPRETSRIP